MKNLFFTHSILGRGKRERKKPSLPPSDTIDLSALHIWLVPRTHTFFPAKSIIVKEYTSESSKIGVDYIEYLRKSEISSTVQ